jgi:hypothetical protein
MTEAEWLVSEDPAAMLRAIQYGYEKWGASVPDRKLRLFACAACRQVWDGVKCGYCKGTGERFRRLGTRAGVYHPYEKCKLCHGTGKVGGLTDPRSRRAVEVAERFADGEATGEELSKARSDAANARNWDGETAEHYPAWMAHVCTCIGSESVVSVTIRQNELKLLVPPATQASLLRCVVGNPFRPVFADPRHALTTAWADGPSGEKVPNGVTTAPGYRVVDVRPWLAWKGGTVPSLARAVYDERRFEDLPILADALEEAGCTDGDILGHLRGPGPHCRGCWALDLIIGKE